MSLEGQPDGQYRIYKNGEGNAPAIVTCASPSPELGMWELVVTQKVTRGGIYRDIAAGHSFSEAYVEFAEGSSWLSAWPDHRISSQTNGVYIAGEWKVMDRRGGTGYAAGNYIRHSYGEQGQHELGLAHYGRIVGHNWSNDTGSFVANIYVR